MPCPSSFRLFAGSETRQNERMWDRQPWNGGQGPWGVCDPVCVCASVFCSHLSVRVCVHGKQGYLLLSCLVLCVEIQHIDFISLSVCSSRFGLDKQGGWTVFETRLRSFSPSAASHNPPTWAERHTPACLHLLLSAVPPWFPEERLCLPRCEGGMLSERADLMRSSATRHLSTCNKSILHKKAESDLMCAFTFTLHNIL